MSKARDKKKRRDANRRASSNSSRQCLSKLRRVFGENSSAMMKLASDGASPSEIAERLQVKESEAEGFIEAFTQLPCGLDRTLLRAPGVLSKHKQMKAMLKSALRSAGSRRIG